jgi:hypothetical protein
MPKSKYTKRRVSKRRVSKRRVSKRRVSKKSKKKMKGGSLFNIAQGVSGAAAVAYIFAPKCKICGRIWKPLIGRDWIWKPEERQNDTTLAGLHYYDFYHGFFNGDGVCGLCNGNNMYNKLISEGKTELTAKIKVIKNLNQESKLNQIIEHWYDSLNTGKYYFYGRDKVLEQLEALNKLELAYKRLYLVKIFEENKDIPFDIPFDLCEIINNHLTTILNE